MTLAASNLYPRFSKRDITSAAWESETTPSDAQVIHEYWTMGGRKQTHAPGRAACRQASP